MKIQHTLLFNNSLLSAYWSLALCQALKAGKTVVVTAFLG